VDVTKVTESNDFLQFDQISRQLVIRH
jgi:hypothetical protein